MTTLSLLLVAWPVAVRRPLARAFDEDPRVGSFATAATLSIALAKVPLLNPDAAVVAVDEDGTRAVHAIEQIHAHYPDLPVVAYLVTASSQWRSRVLRAGAAAATAWSAEPRAQSPAHSPSGSAAEPLLQHVRDRLLLCVADAVGGRRDASHPQEAEDPQPGPARARVVIEAAARTPERAIRLADAPVARESRTGRPDVLALGASTGGPEALEAVLSSLPAEFPLPVLLVQHMPADFTRRFARRLAQRCSLAVDEATDGDEVRPGRVLLAPGGFHMRAQDEDGRIAVRLDRGTPENFCRPSVDVLFRSVAAVYGARVLAVVLTGMGVDGLRGARELVAGGATVLAQDLASSTVWGMPGAVSRAGLAAEVLPLPDLSASILRRASCAAAGRREAP